MLLRCAAVTALLLSAPAAQAEITADALWARWQALAADNDRSLTAQSAVSADGTLELSGIELTHTGLTDTLGLALERVRMTPADGDGVSVTIPSGQRLELSVRETGQDVTERVVLRLGGAPMVMTAAGALEAPSYRLTAPIWQAVLEELLIEGDPVDATATLAAEVLTGDLERPAPPERSLAADLGMARLSLDLNVVDPDSGMLLQSATQQEDTTVAARFDPGAPEGEADWTFDLDFSAGASTTETRQPLTQGGPELLTESSQESLDLSVASTPGRFSYDLSVTDVATISESAGLPISPIEANLGRLDSTLSVPTATGSDVQEARLLVEIDALEVGEPVWSFFDPTGVLPRTTLQAVLDLGADLRLRDALNPNFAVPEVLPQALRINRLELRLGEAEVDAEGALTIPVAAPGTPPDLARAAGTVEMQGRGLLGLLAQVTEAGLVTAEQAMGVQLMIGMFARQGEGDVLDTLIEAEPGGGLVVNGTRLR